VRDSPHINHVFHAFHGIQRTRLNNIFLFLTLSNQNNKKTLKKFIQILKNLNFSKNTAQPYCQQRTKLYNY